MGRGGNSENVHVSVPLVIFLMVVTMACKLGSRLSSWGSITRWGHCIVFSGKTLYSHSTSLNPGV